MIKKIDRYLKKLSRFIDSFQDKDNIFNVTLTFSPELKRTPGQIFREDCYKYGISSEINDNPRFIHQYQPVLELVTSDETIKKSMASAVIQACLDGDVGADSYISQIFLCAYGGGLGHFPMLFAQEKGNVQERTIVLSLNWGSWQDFAAPLEATFRQMGLPVTLTAEPADRTALRERLMERHTRAAEFYLAEPEWTQQFYENLGDDLSRTAFASFIQQRIFGTIFWNTDVAYSLEPTPATGQLRKAALEKLPSMKFLFTPNMITLPFLDLHTFIFEQYRIPGVAEVRPGQTVVDVGATYGDTAIYFSEAMHNEGTVLAVEPMRENIAYLRRNLELHGCRNVEIVPLALSSREGTQAANIDGTPTTVFHFCDKDETGAELIRLTTLDKLAGPRKIDFVKADIEGAELELIHGAANVIRRDRPTFALALYHKKNDFRELPRALSGSYPGYTYYIRIDAEPMLFAVDNFDSERKK